MKNETEIFALISHGGNGRALAYEALEAAENGDFTKSDELIVEAEKEIDTAHNTQTELIKSEINGDKCEASLLMIHAQDHLMTAISEQKLIEHIIHLHKKIDALSAKCNCE